MQRSRCKSKGKTGLRLKEIMPKERVPRNHMSNVKIGLRLQREITKKNRAEE